MHFRFLLSFLFITAVACVEEEKEVKDEETDVDANGVAKFALPAISKELTEALIGSAISAGTSLGTSTVEGLMKSNFNVAASGSIENYSAWPLRLAPRGCTVLSGTVNQPMKSVDPGYKEAFASHKIGNRATGTWMFCPFEVKKKYRVMFMYSVPYSQDFYANTLTVAICKLEKANCRQIDGPGMYYMDLERAELDNKALKSLPKDVKPDYSQIAIDRHDYYSSIRNVKTCLEDLCIRGSMGSSHHPVIRMSVLPTTFSGLVASVSSQSKQGQWEKDQWKEYVENLK